MISLTKTILCIFLGSILFLTIPCQAQESSKQSNILDQPVATEDLSNLPISSVLSSLAVKQRVQIGFEATTARANQEVTNAIRLTPIQGTLREVLNNIVQIAPVYDWNYEDNIISVLPKESKHPLLEVKIAQLHLDNVTAYEASTMLTNLPEVKTLMSTLGLTRRDFLNISGNGSAFSGKRFSIRAENITVRQALNKILEASNRNIWIFSTYGDNNQYVCISL